MIATGVGFRATAATGVLLFGAVLATAVARPDVLERRAHAFVVREVLKGSSRVLAPLDSVADARPLTQLSGRLSAGADSRRARLDRGLSARIARFLASVCYYCRPADSLELAVTPIAESQIGLLQRASATAMAWARHRYAETVTALVRDLRIFSGVNMTLFLLLLGASFLAPSTSDRAPGLALWLLLLATGISIVGYVFVQNWFYALLTGRYIGYGYALWVAAVFLTLVDWTLNRGRVSQALFNLVGAAVSAT